MTPQQLAARFVSAIINPILTLLMAFGLLIFVFGIIEFLWYMSKGEHKRMDMGKQHMLYGLLGMFVMVSAWAIMRMIAGLVGTTI